MASLPTTDERYSDDRDSYQPERYGDRWAPVLVAFDDPTDNPALQGTVVGMGGSSIGTAAGRRFWVTGAVSLDAGYFADARYSSARKVAVIMHELGHVVGVAHVEDQHEVMKATAGQVSFGPGDLAGLAALGRGACAPSL